MPFRLGREREEVPLAVSGLLRSGRHASFAEIEKKLRGRKENVVAWVIGPGGYSYHLTEPDAEGRQEISRYIEPAPGRPYLPVEHVELKQVLERSGAPHEMHVMDLSEENLALAKRQLDASGVNAANVHYLQGNVAEALPQTKPPHVIACHNVLFYLGPRTAGDALERLLAALPKDGLLSLSEKDVEQVGRNRFKELTRNARVEQHGQSFLVVKRMRK